MRGELLCATDPDEGERAISAAFSLARAQGAHWFALRAALAMARGFRDGALRERGRERLVEALAAIECDRPLADLQEARRLLDQRGMESSVRPGPTGR